MDPPIEETKPDRRRSGRFKAPKGMLVGWQGGGKRNASRADTLSTGGVFLCVSEPLSVGTMVQLIFDAPSGEVRARATIRHGRAGRGMGVQFVHMDSDSRARLYRFVQQLEKEQRKEVVATPLSWFTHDGQPLDSGEIRGHHELFALLNKIYSARLTGKLQLVLGRVEKQLFFDGGQLIFATSSDRQDSLGEMMLRAGALTQSQFEEAFELVRTGQRFGSAVAEMGVYSVEEVAGWVQRQLTQITSSVLDYPSCRYYFFSSLEKNVVPEIGMPVPLGKLLLEAVYRANDLPLDHLAEDGDLWVELTPDPLRRYQAVELGESERCLLGAISRVAAVKELLHQSGLPKARAVRALYTLMVLGTVVCVPRGAQTEQDSAVLTPPPEPERPPLEESQSQSQFEEEVRRLLELAEKGTYYDLLGVNGGSLPSQVKESFHCLARKFHPDRHMGQSERLGLLQDLMSQLTTAYKTLVDDKKRASYDKQIAEAGAFTLGQSKTESQKTVDDCLARAKQCLRAHNFAGSILWLRKCVEIAPDVAKHQALLARSLAAVPQYRQEAVHHFEKAIELDGWNTSTYFQFGELYELMRLPWRAIPLYRKILEIDPEHNKALERLSKLEPKQEDQLEKSFQFVSSLFRRKV
jgi:tetratricopeptide (TPR) repeat protein